MSTFLKHTNNQPSLKYKKKIKHEDKKKKETI